jgi:hypothetical protein
MLTFKEFLNESVVKFRINKDLSVDAFQSVDISDRCLREIPVQFNIVNSYFDCADNKLTSLKGAPKEVNGDFYCTRNRLTSLEGGPTEVKGDFDCYNNKLTSLEGCPKEVGRNFSCYKNSTKFTKEDVKKVCEVGRKIYI